MQKIRSRALAVLAALALTVSGSVIAGAPAQAVSNKPAVSGKNSASGKNAASNKAAASTRSAVSAKGPTGQTLTASVTKNLPIGQTTKITVTGKGYNLKSGIYVTFCVVPDKGKKPELCGPFDITGKNNQSIWISSNPPLYGAALVKPFSKGGTFKVSLPVDSMIDDFDCTKIKCAVVTRADHTQPDNRKADVIIPVTFK